METFVRRGIAAAILLAMTLVGGCARRQQGETGGDTEKETGGVPVVVAAVGRGPMSQTVTITGTIRSDRQADVSAQVSAKVVEVKVREGDQVTQGQVLIALDRVQAESQVRRTRAGAEAARARLEAAQRRLEIIEEGAREEEVAIARSRWEQSQSALRTAAADLDRLKGLFEQGAVSKQRLDAAQTAYDTARTNRDAARRSLDLLEKGARPEEIEAARKDVEAAAAGLEQAKAGLAEDEQKLSHTVIHSPVTGVVYERNVEPGEITMLGGGVPLLRVADYSSVYYEAAVSERAALVVRPGQRVEVGIRGDRERSVVGEVARLVPVADPESRDFLLRVRVVENAEMTKPGMFARGEVVVEERPDALLIPKDALVERQGETVVFVVRDGTAELRSVEIGLSDRANVEMLSGVDVGESVVVIGAQGLKDGDRVRLQEAEGS
jgi:RND family efflux transporter MFP subunit